MLEEEGADSSRIDAFVEVLRVLREFDRQEDETEQHRRSDEACSSEQDTRGRRFGLRSGP